MLKSIVNFLNLKLELLNYFDLTRCLCELKTESGDDGITAPKEYVSNGNWDNIDFDAFDGVSYWRLRDEITTSPLENAYKAGKRIETTVPLKLVFSVRRDKLTADDAYSYDRIRQTIVKQFNIDDGALKTSLGAEKILITSPTANGDAKEVWDGETDNTGTFEPKYEVVFGSVDIDVVIISKGECLPTECDDVDSDILHAFDFCSAAVRDRLTQTQVDCLIAAYGNSCDPVTEQINGVTIGTTPSGDTNNQLIQDSAGASVGTEANPSIVGDATATVNGVSMASIPAEGTENIEVRQETGATLVGSQQGQFWRVSDATIQNNATPTWSDTIEAEGTLTLGQAKALDSDGTTTLLANYIPSADGFMFTCTAGGGACPSVSLAISDTTPDFGDTITLTATATDFTGAITYHFIVQDYLGNWSKITQVADNTYDYTCPYAGTFDIHVICEDGSGNTASACESITVGTFGAKHGFTAGWSGVGMSDIVSNRLNSLTDIVSATYTASAPSASERPLAHINAVTDEASTFRAGDNDNRLQTTLTSIADNVMIAFVFDFTNNEDQGDFNALTLIGGDGGASEGARFGVTLRDNSVTREIFAFLINASAAQSNTLFATPTIGRNIGLVKYDSATNKLRFLYNGVAQESTNAGGLWGAAGDYQLLNSRANGRAFPEPVHAIYIRNSATSISDAEQDAAYADLLLKFPNP